MGLGDRARSRERGDWQSDRPRGRSTRELIDVAVLGPRATLAGPGLQKGWEEDE